MRKESYSHRPVCPRCGLRQTTSVSEPERTIHCIPCGYTGHWRQFFVGEKERDLVRKMFDKGNLEGKLKIDTGQ